MSTSAAWFRPTPRAQHSCSASCGATSFVHKYSYHRIWPSEWSPVSRPSCTSPTLLTEVDIPNPDGAVTPGTHCMIELRIPRKIRGPVIPAEAIILTGGALEVAVVSEGIAHLRKISVARDLGTEVEAAGGVVAGDLVIVNPPVGLADGARVGIGSEPVGERR